jgi:hypothetical protein
MKWIRATIIAVLVNETIKSALIGRVMKSFSGMERPSTSPMRGSNQADHLRILIEAALTFMMLRLRKGSSNMQPAAIPIIAALLASLIEPATRTRPQEQSHEKRKQVIDIDDYSIIDEK